MVSPQRINEKLNRAQSKMMEYEEMLNSGRNPLFTEVINRKQSRLGMEMTDLERARAVQAMHDIYVDIERNLKRLGISMKDYYGQLAKQGIEDYPAILTRVKTEIDALANPKKKGGKKKNAET